MHKLKGLEGLLSELGDEELDRLYHLASAELMDRALGSRENGADSEAEGRGDLAGSSSPAPAAGARIQATEPGVKDVCLKAYRGVIEPDGPQVYICNPQGATPLALRLDLRAHSPGGFEWGYSGSGPAQLALAILVDFTGDEALALRLYQDFKADVIAGLPQGAPFILRERVVRSWLRLKMG